MGRNFLSTRLTWVHSEVKAIRSYRDKSHLYKKKKKAGAASEAQSTCLCAQDPSALHGTAKGREGKEKGCLQLDPLLTHT